MLQRPAAGFSGSLSGGISLNAFLRFLGTVNYQTYPYSEDLTELGFNPVQGYRKIVCGILADTTVSSPNRSLRQTKKQENFGVLLASGNIERHLADIREQQARYRAEHSEDLANIRAWVAAH
jgi:hypothetical protein